MRGRSVLHQVHTHLRDSPRHGGALLELHTGSDISSGRHRGHVDYLRFGHRTVYAGLSDHLSDAVGTAAPIISDPPSCPLRYAGTAIGSVGIAARERKVPFITNAETPRTIQRIKELQSADESGAARAHRAGPRLGWRSNPSSLHSGCKPNSGFAGPEQRIGKQELLRARQSGHRGFWTAVFDGSSFLKRESASFR